ncbi:hypothetical protein T07_8168, partial [Trichinella nelsoni]
MSVVYEGRAYKLKQTVWGRLSAVPKCIQAHPVINKNRLLAIGKTWGMDSTFKIVPE